MKAITCPQCGALIKRIPVSNKIALCDYCEAKIILPENQDKPVEIPEAENKLTPWEQHQENYRKVKERASRYDAPYTYPQPESRSFAIPAVVGIIGLTLAIIFWAASGKNSSPANVKEKTLVKTVPSPKIEYPIATPAPQINYQVKVQWSGSNDMEHFENPQIDNSKLPSLDENELKKTVFKNRGVQVKITINTDGEVTSAEAVSGHPVLREAAVEAAKKTLFNSRQKPTTRVLTYYFRLTKE
jgi:hypothetical protein